MDVLSLYEMDIWIIFVVEKSALNLVNFPNSRKIKILTVCNAKTPRRIWDDDCMLCLYEMCLQSEEHNLFAETLGQDWTGTNTTWQPPELMALSRQLRTLSNNSLIGEDSWRWMIVWIKYNWIRYWPRHTISLFYVDIHPDFCQPLILITLATFSSFFLPGWALWPLSTI